MIAEPPTARGADLALLDLLCRSGVDFVVVGPIAAALRGAHGVDPARPPDIVPRPGLDNLTALTGALTRAGAVRMRVGDGRHATLVDLHASLFEHLSVLPLLTDLGDLTVVMRPVGGIGGYDGVLAESGDVEWNGLRLRVPTVEALLLGLCAAWHAPDTNLIGELRRVQRIAALVVDARAGASPDVELARRLEHDVLALVSTTARAMTIREMLAQLGARPTVTYQQLRAAADSLAARGAVRRKRVGTANRYARAAGSEALAARQIAALLRDTPHPEEVASEALRLLDGAADA